MLGIFTPSGQSQVVHFILGHLDFHVVYFPFPLLLTPTSSQQLFSFPLAYSLTGGKVYRIKDLEGALETLSWRHC